MAKKISEDKADLLLNEKVEISINDTMQEYLDDVLKANDFWVRGNQLIELANALGTGAFIEYMDGEEPKIDYVSALHIWPLSWLNGKITECAFASKFTVKEGERAYIQRHLLEGRRYVIYNNLYDKAGKEIELPEGVLPVWNTGSEEPLFQIIKPNICNNIDLINPMGISAYANSIDDLESVDLIYDSHYNEFMLGKKRIFVDDSMVKPNPKDGSLMPIFDPRDTVFYGIPGKENDKAITESNMNLRVEAHVKGLQMALDILSEKVGFGKGFYKFEGGEVKTATEVVSQNSKLFRRIKKDELILETALTNLTRALLFLGGKNAETDISISFDDSIIEDTEAIANRSMRERTAGIIDDVIYFKRVYGLTEEAAIQLVAEIAARAPAPEPSPFEGM
jgi:A118 family predicted phage portal protein